MIEVEWDWDVVNEAFKPLIHNKDRYLIMYGGRGSSKSDFAAKSKIHKCIDSPFFRCIMIREVQAKVKDSCYQNLKDLIIEMGLYSLFSFVSTPVPRITCIINGNFFVGAGTDNVQGIKSVKDPTDIWWEEDIPTESDFITITTSLRTTKAEFIQEIFSINPECEGDYKELWFYKKFFAKNYELDKLSFSDKITIEVDNKPIDVPFTVHHSTHHNNPHLPDQYRAMLLDLKRTNPYYYQVYTLGKWGTKIVSGRFYQEFHQGKHTFTGNRYNPDLALHISFDFNVNPYTSLSIWQVIGKRLICIDEIAAREPHNSTSGACALFDERYDRHEAGLFVYGDPTGKNEDSKYEKGHNHYSIIKKELKRFMPQTKLFSKAPSVTMRGNFINAIFLNNEQGITIEISETCTNLTNDLLFGKMASDGTKYKEKGKDKESGISVEKYHHFSDNLDYLVCKVCYDEYRIFKRGGHSFDYSL
jgi:phage terminase large subunit